MGESLWADLGAWQVSKINAAMGQPSAYTTLKLKTVTTMVVWDLRTVTEWSKPAVAVLSFHEDRQPGPHGDGDAHSDKMIRGAWMAIAEGTLSNAERDAKILLKRMEKLLLGLYKQDFDIDPDDSGERLVNLYLRHSEISAHRLQSSNDLWMVMAGIALDFETEV